MNNEKIAGYIQNIFHLDNLEADDDTFIKGSIFSDHWGKGIRIRWIIRDFGDEKDVNLRYVYSMGSYNINIDSGMTAKEASKEIVDLIGRVLISQADTADPHRGFGQILAWPYNCNLGYVESLIEALQYGDNPIENSKKPITSAHNGEDECGMCEAESDILVEDLKESLGQEGYNMDIVNEFFDDKELDDYDSLCYDCERKLRKEFEKYSTNRSAAFSSRKPIKSTYDNEIYRQAFACLLKDSEAKDFDNGDYGKVHYPGWYRILVDGNYETEYSAETDEEAIQKFHEYFDNKKKGINNSKKSIKSSFDVLYDYIDKGVFWEDVEDYADQLIQEGKFTLDEYNSEKDKLREYFNNEEEKAKKTAWENEGRENGFLNSSRNQSSLNKIFS